MHGRVPNSCSCGWRIPLRGRTMEIVPHRVRIGWLRLHRSQRSATRVPVANTRICHVERSRDIPGDSSTAARNDKTAFEGERERNRPLAHCGEHERFKKTCESCVAAEATFRATRSTSAQTSPVLVLAEIQRNVEAYFTGPSDYGPEGVLIEIRKLLCPS
jgi:hypothetical protein